MLSVGTKATSDLSRVVSRQEFGVAVVLPPLFRCGSTTSTAILLVNATRLVTMVRSIRCLATPASFVERRVVGRMSMLVFWWLGTAAMLSAQQPGVHYLHQGIMPPGAIGSRQLQRGGPLPGYFQPVEIKAPAGALVSLAVDNEFDQSRPAPRKAGMLIGAVYRLRVTNIRLAEGAEVFPTIEVDRPHLSAARSGTPLRHSDRASPRKT